MKVKSLVFAAVASAFMYSCGNQETASTEQASVATESTAPEATYSINTESSVINWKGTMAGIKSHYGTMKIKEGSLNLSGNQVKSGSFVADIVNIVPTDENYNAESPKENLIGHLKSADFFATDSFPTATFVITAAEGNILKGNLTLRGKTNEEQVTDVVVTNDENGVKATGKLVFNRQKYGVAWQSPMKDVVLNDDIEVDVVLVGTK